MAHIFKVNVKGANRNSGGGGLDLKRHSEIIVVSSSI